MGGYVGMRYEAVYPLLDRMTADPDEWDRLLEDVGVLEAAALAAINTKPDQA